MTILFTGATGFIGSSIVKGVLDQGHQVVAIKRVASDLSRLDSHLNANLIFYNVEEIALADIFKNHNIDQVVHLATTYGRTEGHDAVLKTNFHFPVELLNCSIENNVKRFIGTDTFSSKVDGLDYLPAYHISKRLFKDWAMLLVKDKPIEFLNLYLQHPYGPFDHENKFVPFIIDNLKVGKPSLDLTAGLQERDFIYIDDVVNAYLCVIKAPKLEKTSCDVGTGVNTSIRNFVELAKEITNNNTTKLNFGKLPTRGNELMKINCDNSYLKSLGWEPNYSLEKGLNRIMEIYADA